MGETGGSYGGKTKFQPGGTPGGAGEFLGGLVMMAIGIYMVFDRVTVHTSFWRFFGSAQASFGVMLMPLLVGVGVLAFSGKSMLGWLLTGGGMLFIVAGVLMNLDIYFQPTTPVGDDRHVRASSPAGLGLFAKSLRAHAAAERRPA